MKEIFIIILCYGKELNVRQDWTGISKTDMFMMLNTVDFSYCSVVCLVIPCLENASEKLDPDHVVQVTLSKVAWKINLLTLIVQLGKKMLSCLIS